MKIIAIAAIAVDGTIGIGNTIPWRISEDFKHYRKTTMGNMLLVGANTFKTLPPKAHEGRRFIILSRTERLDLTGNKYYQFSDINTVLHLFEDNKNDFEQVFVIGGARIYDILIDYCDEAIITWVNKSYPNGNKKFPIDKLFANFTAVNDSAWIMSKTEIEYKIRKYERNQ